MTPLVLVHALILGDPTPTCPPSDPGCQAERFAALAEKSATHDDRVLRLFAAHRSYFDLYERTHDEDALCRARETLDRAVSLTPTPAHLVDAIADARRKTREREQAGDVDCRARAKKPSTAMKTRKAATTATAKDELPPKPLVEDDPPPLLTRTIPTSSAQAPSPSLPPNVSKPATPATSALEAPPRPPPSNRVRLPPARIAGGTILFAVSAGFAVGAWASLDARADVVRRYQELEAAINEAGREPTTDELTQRDRLDRQYGRLSFGAGLTGVAASVGVIAGVVLLAAPPKKQRISAAPWAGPRVAGLTIRGHF